MRTYIGLLNFTDQGIKTLKDVPIRISSGRQALESNGGKLHNYFLTMGHYDAVVIIEAPEDEAMASFLIAQAGHGNIRSTTLGRARAGLQGVAVGLGPSGLYPLFLH